MPSPQNKLLQQWLAPEFKAAGFTKTGATWHRARPPFIHVFNIQGSQWGLRFYLNLGLYISDLGALSRPKEYDCHLRKRLDDLVPDPQHLARLCDFELPLDETERRAQLQALVAAYAIPWLDGLSSREQLHQYILQRRTQGKAVRKELLEYLALEEA